MNDSDGVGTTADISSKTEKTHKRNGRHKSKSRGKKANAANRSAGMRPYPRITLEKSLLVAHAIKDKNGGNPWAADQIAKALGISPKNSLFTYYLLSSKKFGLREGASTTGLVSLTDLGRRIVYSGSPDEELAAKREAFLSVEIFKNVLEHYNGSRLPEMQYLGNTLESKFRLDPKFHQEFSDLFRQNCDFVGLGSATPTSTRAEASGSKQSDVIVLGEPKMKTGLVCFVIMPFVEKTTSYSAGFFEEVLNSLIIPAARDAGFEVKTANRQGSDIIHSTIVNEILDADLCICDLTEHNPNVLFELGMRLAHDKPVALIHAEGTPRVFDVDNVVRVLPYKKELWRTTIQKDLPDLTSHIKATWEKRETGESYYRLLRKMKPKAQSATA